MAAAEPFGPFRADVDPVERIAQLRVLRTLVHVLVSPDLPNSFEVACLHCEHDPDPAISAVALSFLEELPALTRRRILATFAYIHKPLYSSARTQPKKGTANASVE